MRYTTLLSLTLCLFLSHNAVAQPPAAQPSSTVSMHLVLWTDFEGPQEMDVDEANATMLASLEACCEISASNSLTGTSPGIIDQVYSTLDLAPPEVVGQRYLAAVGRYWTFWEADAALEALEVNGRHGSILPLEIPTAAIESAPGFVVAEVPSIHGQEMRLGSRATEYWLIDTHADQDDPRSRVRLGTWLSHSPSVWPVEVISVNPATFTVTYNHLGHYRQRDWTEDPQPIAGHPATTEPAIITAVQKAFPEVAPENLIVMATHGVGVAYVVGRLPADEVTVTAYAVAHAGETWARGEVLWATEEPVAVDALAPAPLPTETIEDTGPMPSFQF